MTMAPLRGRRGWERKVDDEVARQTAGRGGGPGAGAERRGRGGRRFGRGSSRTGAARA